MERLQTTIEEGTPAAIIDLPLELLSEILKYAEWKDILRIRQTCRRLNSDSKARDIWDSIFRRLVQTCLENRVEPPHIERPLETYTSSELEYVVLRWASAQLGWESSGNAPIRERIISTPESGDVHLVEGGRWLLVVDNRTAAITYFDLEAPVVTREMLTPPVLNKSKICRSILMHVEMDYQSPTLSFNLALSVLRELWLDYPVDGPPDRLFESRILIWHVDLVLDAHGKGVALVAQCISSFSHHPEIERDDALHLSGCHLFLSCQFGFGDSGKCCILIIEWQIANGRGIDYPMHIISQAWPVRYLLPLPDSKLLALSGFQIKVYDLSVALPFPIRIFASAFPFHDAILMSPPLWEIESPGIIYSRDASATYISPDIICVIFPIPSRGELYNISIHIHDGVMHPPVISKLVDLPVSASTISQYTAAQYHMAVTSYDRKLIFTHYLCQETDKPSAPQPKYIWKVTNTRPDYDARPHVDLSSGRIVLMGPTDDQKIILDFARLNDHS